MSEERTGWARCKGSQIDVYGERMGDWRYGIDRCWSTIDAVQEMSYDASCAMGPRAAAGGLWTQGIEWPVRSCLCGREKKPGRRAEEAEGGAARRQELSRRTRKRAQTEWIGSNDCF